ncbi:UNVERIFIED_CONTAM: hypothetical protein NY603_24950, partial [Bacteroidetes bacterium 56_B9]
IGLSAFAIIGLTSFVAIVGYGLVLRSESKQNNEIQDQRREYVRQECQDVNTRHKNSSESLIEKAGEDIKNAPTKEAKTEIKRRRDVTLALI